MKRLMLNACVLWVALDPLCAFSQESAPKPLQCNIGPLTKTYGLAPWLVYSCDDNRTVVIISAPDSPAAPFYFIFYPTNAGYHLGGEGTGRKDITDAAFVELKTLSDQDIKTLIEQTKLN